MTKQISGKEKTWILLLYLKVFCETRR